MAFSQNNSAANDFSLKPEGNYEVIITGIEERTTKKGKTWLNFKLTIRNDVEGQKYGNACLFYKIWKAVNPTAEDLSVDGYIFSRVMGVGKAAKLPDGKEYKDLKEYCNELIGKCVIAVLKHEVGDDDVVREVVNYLNETKHPDCKHKFKEPAVKSDTVAPPKNESFAAAANTAAADDDDAYPF